MRTTYLCRKCWLVFFCIHTIAIAGWLPPLMLPDEELFVPLNPEVALNAPSSFGETHFIVGYDQAVPEKQSGHMPKKEVFPLTCDGHVCSALFAPDQKIGKKLKSLIDHEHETICVAAYMITDKRIAQALIAAHKRGVRVEVVVDPGCVQDRSNKIGMLYEAGITVYVYVAKSKGLIRSLMHDKFVLFGNNIYHRSIVWTGSANFTCKADEVNQENIVVLDDHLVYKRFVEQFGLLKQRSERYERSLITNAELHERAKKMNDESTTK